MRMVKKFAPCFVLLSFLVGCSGRNAELEAEIFTTMKGEIICQHCLSRRAELHLKKCCLPGCQPPDVKDCRYCDCFVKPEHPINEVRSAKTEIEDVWNVSIEYFCLDRNPTTRTNNFMVSYKDKKLVFVRSLGDD